MIYIGLRGGKSDGEESPSEVSLLVEDLLRLRADSSDFVYVPL
jgi:hypothetical protein